MVTFKEVMGFFLLATVLWLVWVFGAQTDYFSLFLLLTGFLSLAFACWIFGKWGTPIVKKQTRYLATILAALFLVAGGYAVVVASTAEAEQVSPEASAGWEPFSIARVQELQQQGIPVLIDFTAKWCLICQTNHLVFLLPHVDEKLEQMGVVRMMADWTRNDPEITKALRDYGRSGVPLYLLYGKNPDQPPMVLPQVLTADIVLDYLKKIEKQ